MLKSRLSSQSNLSFAGVEALVSVLVCVVELDADIFEEVVPEGVSLRGDRPVKSRSACLKACDEDSALLVVD